MKKIIVGIVAATAIASPIALATSANAEVVSSDPTCSPVKHVNAWTETLYKYSPVKVNEGPTQWDIKDAPAGFPKTWTVKGKTVNYFRDGNKTSTVAHPVIEGVTCSVTLPEHFAGEGTYTVVVPFVKGVDTFLFGVQGYDQNVAIDHDVTVTKSMAAQFWIGHTAQEGYVIANPTTAQWHIDFTFATGPNDVKLNDAATSEVSKHVDLPDEFLTQHEGGYFSTQVESRIINNTGVDQVVSVMYKDQQDGPLWIERGVFDNWTNQIVIPAWSAKTFTFDVWYDAPVGSPSEVPDDLTLDFNVNATPVV